MKVQIFTRNFVGSIPGFEIKGDSTIGGAEVYIKDLSKMLVDMGFEVEIVQATYNEPWEKVIEGTKAKNITLNKSERFFFPLILPSMFSKMEERDSLKIYNGAGLAIGRDTKNGKALGIFHGVEWDTSFFGYVSREIKYRSKTNLSGILDTLIRYVYFAVFDPMFVKIGISKLDKVVSVDSNIFNYIPSRLKPKIEVVHNYVDCQLFKPSPPYEKQIKTIMVPRNLNPGRGVYLVPEIAKEMLKVRKDFLFKITGTGPLKDYLEKKIHEEALEDYVKLIGHVSHENMPELYRESYIVLIPTIFSEGTSLSALEALASQRVLVTTDVGGLKEIGQNMEAKVIVKPDSKDIAEKLLLLLDNHDLYERIAKQGRDYVCRSFNKTIWQDKWKKIMEKTLP
jgi:glycosyltransferase involved in cell wall biosynthesis